MSYKLCPNQSRQIQTKQISHQKRSKTTTLLCLCREENVWAKSSFVSPCQLSTAVSVKGTAAVSVRSQQQTHTRPVSTAVRRKINPTWPKAKLFKNTSLSVSSSRPALIFPDVKAAVLLWACFYIFEKKMESGIWTQNRFRSTGTGNRKDTNEKIANVISSSSTQLC